MTIHAAPSAAELSHDQGQRDLGKNLAAALLTQQDWVIRTLEQLDFMERDVARRTITRHFRVPTDLGARPINADGCHLPAFSIRKSQEIGSELWDIDDRRIVLATVEERWRLSWLAIMTTLEFGAGLSAYDSRVGECLWLLVRSPPDKSNSRMRRLERVTEEVRASQPLLADALANDAFVDLAQYLSQNFVVYVTVDPNTPIHAIRYALQQPFRTVRIKRPRADTPNSPRPAPRRVRLMRYAGVSKQTFLHSWPLDGAGSYHLSINAPLGLQLGWRELEVPNRRAVRWPGTSANQARFVAPRGTPKGEARVVVEVSPASGILRAGGPAVGLLTAVLIAIFAAAHAKVAGDAATAAAIALVIPSLASLIAARPDENPYVTRVVLGVRGLTLVPLVVSVLAAVVLLAQASVVYLWALVAIATSATVILGWGALATRTRRAQAPFVSDEFMRIS